MFISMKFRKSVFRDYLYVGIAELIITSNYYGNGDFVLAVRRVTK